MKMKTIINTSKSSPISYPLALSILAHIGLWSLSVNVDHRFEVAERFTEVLKQPHLTTMDRFVQVELPKTPAPEPVAEVSPEPSPEPPKAQPKKRRVKRRRVAQKHIAKRAPKKVVQRSVAPPASVPSNVSASAQVATVSQAVSAPSVSVDTPSSDAPTVVQRRLSRSELRGLQRGYYSELNQIMRRERSYPRSARRRGLEGTVLVELVVDARGRLIKASVIRSSGHEVLDQAALADVRKMKSLPKPPKALKRRSVKLHIPFEYSLQS